MVIIGSFMAVEDLEPFVSALPLSESKKTGDERSVVEGDTCSWSNEEEEAVMFSLQTMDKTKGCGGLVWLFIENHLCEKRNGNPLLAHARVGERVRVLQRNPLRNPKGVRPPSDVTPTERSSLHALPSYIYTVEASSYGIAILHLPNLYRIVYMFLWI